MGSKRLPGKVMKIIDKKNPLIFYVISQLKQSTKIQNIIVATTVLKEDDEIKLNYYIQQHLRHLACHL